METDAAISAARGLAPHVEDAVRVRPPHRRVRWSLTARARPATRSTSGRGTVGSCRSADIRRRRP